MGQIDAIDEGDIDYDLCMNSGQLCVLEYVVANKENADQREQTWIDTGLEDESDDDLKWYDELFEKDVKSALNETYMVFVNDTREKMRAGDQVFINYGPRTNAFLFYNYGFAFADNKNDSYKLQLRLDIDLNKTLEPTVDQMI